MRKELKIIGSRDRHVFTATFIRFGFRDGYKGPVKTILLQNVLLDDKIVTDHLWFDLTKGFESADLLPGDVVEFCARVSIYEKGYKGYRNDVFGRPIEKDYRLSRPTKIKKIETKVEYGRLNTEKGTYAHWLNCVTCISYNRYKPVMEVECNECTSKLFVDMIKSVCNISEQVKSFINPEQIKAIAESNEPILLLSNN